MSRLLHADRSFSGGERHCAFLNLDGERFADISAVTGFDFAEDGRALVMEDWDFDGDLDVWVTARTAPRIRLLENGSQNAGESLFIRLQGNGTSTNPDAIGARCEVWLKGDERPITRSLKAGDSFLSQASSWLHFGLGREPQIARVVVHWPAGRSEEFTGLEAGKRFLLYQGQPGAKQWSPPIEMAKKTAEPLILPYESEQARIVLPNPVLLPLLQTEKGETIGGNDLQGPVLINLWSRTCSTCLDELKEWTGAAPQFKKNGLRISALNVDEVSDPGSADQTKQFLTQIGFPFPAIATNGDTLQRLDLFQRSFLDRWLPLPVPCSFLVDNEGKAAVIYKGAANAETILADMALLGADPETLRNEGTPFAGKWVSPVPVVGPGKYVAQLLDHKMVADTERYYERYLKIERQYSAKPISSMVDGLKILATIASSRKNFEGAVSYLKEAVDLAPQAKDLQPLLKKAEMGVFKARAESSLEPLLAKVQANPTDGNAHLALANAYRTSGKTAEAVESYKNALSNDPKLFVAAGRLAWILATHPSEDIREPKAALELANRLMTLNGGTDPSFLDLQGIAFAANGDYDAAIKNARAALDHLKGDSPYKKAVQYRLGLYEDEKPYYEGTASP